MESLLAPLAGGSLRHLLRFRFLRDFVANLCGSRAERQRSASGAALLQPLPGFPFRGSGDLSAASPFERSPGQPDAGGRAPGHEQLASWLIRRALLRVSGSEEPIRPTTSPRLILRHASGPTDSSVGHSCSGETEDP